MKAVREAGLACAAAAATPPAALPAPAAAPGPDPARLNAGWKPPVLQRSR